MKPFAKYPGAQLKMRFACMITTVIISIMTYACQKKKTDTGKQLYTCPMHPDVISDKPGKCSKCGMDLTLSKKEVLKREVVKLYTCPMHPDVVSDKPGKCSKCGMDLVEKKTPARGKMKKDSTGMKM